MLTCPHCDQSAMPHARKALLGPTRAVPCQSCGKRVSVHWGGIVALVPFFAVLLAGMHFGLPFVVALLAGMLPMLAGHVFLVPLVKRDT